MHSKIYISRIVKIPRRMEASEDNELSNPPKAVCLQWIESVPRISKVLQFRNIEVGTTKGVSSPFQYSAHYTNYTVHDHYEQMNMLMVLT
jgi:hypothetical protein